MDCKDVYLKVPIHPDHQEYLMSQCSSNFYQFTCHSFGQLAPPRPFSKLIKCLATDYSVLGYYLIICLEDILIFHYIGQQPAEVHYSYYMQAVWVPGVVSKQEASANTLISAGASRIPAMYYDTENLTTCIHMPANSWCMYGFQQIVVVHGILAYTIYCFLLVV